MFCKVNNLLQVNLYVSSYFPSIRDISEVTYILGFWAHTSEELFLKSGKKAMYTYAT